MRGKLRVWEPWEDEFMLANYGMISRQEIAKKLNRTISAISNRAKRLDLRTEKSPDWTEEEIKFMRSNWRNMSIKNIAKRLGRSLTAVEVKAARLQLGPQIDPQKWTAQEISYLLRVDSWTVLRWIENGLLKAKKAPLVGQKIYQISTSELLRFLKENPGRWDARRNPDLHLDIKRKDLLGPEHWKMWGTTKKKSKRQIPEHLKDSFTKFVISVAKAAADRILDGRKQPDWLKEKLKQDQQLADHRFAAWTEEEDLKLAALFKKGLSYKEIGEKLGRSGAAVGHRLKRINVWEILERERVVI